MKYFLIIVILFSFSGLKSQEIWQLQPWATDSTYVLGALGTGEPSWVQISGISSKIDSVIYDNDTLYIYTVDTLFKAEIVSGGGGIDSTIIIDGYGINVAESPANTWTVTVDTAQIATLYDVSLKQNTLVSGTNIKTVNSNSLLGSGDLEVGTIRSLNGLTGSTQTFAVSTASAGFGINSSTSTHTFNLPYQESSFGLRLGLNAKVVSNSTMIGYDAGANLTGGNNVGIGKGAVKGGVGSTGTNNIGIGFETLLAVTSGVNNVAAGSYALGNLTTGNYNFGFGEQSLLVLTTGSDNVGMGRYSLRLQTGSYSVGLGSYSFKTSTGNGNTGIGYGTGELNTGSYNTFLGFGAGYGSGATSNSIYIGSNAGSAVVRSNTLIIDNVSTSTGLITGQFDNDRVGINTDVTTLARTLHVTGEARITDLVTDTPTKIVGADNDGDLGTVAIGTGLSLSSGTLSATATGTVTGSGTTGYVPYWTSSSALGNSTVYSNSNGLGFGTTSPLFALHLLNKSIYLQGNSTIIDKNNSGGTAGYFLMGTGGFGVDWEFLALSRTGARDLSLTGGSTLVNCLVPAVGVSGQVLTNTGSGTYAWQNSVTSAVGNAYLSSGYTDFDFDLAYRSIVWSSAIVNNGITYTSGDSTLTVAATGTYEVEYSVSFTNSSGHKFTTQFDVYKNGSSIGGRAKQQTTLDTNTDSGYYTTVSNKFFVDLTSGDDLKLVYARTKGTINVFAPYSANFIVKRLY